MQKRRPVGLGPSSKTWPRCASHSVHSTSLRVMPKLRSVFRFTFCFAIGSQKLGQPVPESNLVAEVKRAFLQHTQRKIPLACRSQYWPVKACSVPSLRVTSNCSGVNWARHSASVLTTFSMRFGPIFSPESLNSTISTYCVDGPAAASERFNKLIIATPDRDRKVVLRKSLRSVINPSFQCQVSSFKLVAGNVCQIEVGELLLKMCHLGQIVVPDVKVVGMQRRVVLVISLRRIERLERHHLGHDGARKCLSLV